MPPIIETIVTSITGRGDWGPEGGYDSCQGHTAHRWHCLDLNPSLFGFITEMQERLGGTVG